MAYCVFDRDTHPTFDAALKLIEKHNKHASPKIKAIISNPCFEIWFLLHYKYSTRSYMSNIGGKKAWEYIIEEIPSNFFRSYAKGSYNIYDELKGNTPIAIKNAEKLAEYQQNNQNSNPYTDVFRLVTEFQAEFQI